MKLLNNLFLGFGMAAFVGFTTGCQTVDEPVIAANIPGHVQLAPTEAPVVIAEESAAVEEEVYADTSAEEVTTATMGSTANTPCGLNVVALSTQAVGNPCWTTMEFMQSIGLSQDSIAQVQKLESTAGHAH